MTVAKFRKPVTNHKLLVNYTRKWHSLREACHCLLVSFCHFFQCHFSLKR